MYRRRYGRIIVSILIYLAFLSHLIIDFSDPELRWYYIPPLYAIFALLTFLASLLLSFVLSAFRGVARLFLRFWGLHDYDDLPDFGAFLSSVFITMISVILIGAPIWIIIQNPYRFPILHGILDFVINFFA